MSELSEAEIVKILAEKRAESSHRRYMLNRERYKRRANIRYALRREEVCAQFRERYATDAEFREHQKLKSKLARMNR